MMYSENCFRTFYETIFFGPWSQLRIFFLSKTTSGLPNASKSGSGLGRGCIPECENHFSSADRSLHPKSNLCSHHRRRVRIRIRARVYFVSAKIIHNPVMDRAPGGGFTWHTPSKGMLITLPGFEKPGTHCLRRRIHGQAKKDFRTPERHPGWKSNRFCPPVRIPVKKNGHKAHF